ncbi:PepSY domain-containing protein [Cereibacter sphaeroides]|uniref:PepSY domain-containing protein n=1 Tax=Cereibacter sphaeroides TaxID=1063 RepID=UPI001F187E67|nr:PepSY domain-containing protein [Cereibacter sphaeroides]MCE6957806.1 PepSY domain-containing protein [Cereibacter sphaeroides]MCE6969857.1 PepSY domain-containing protein [Cereibacter sphaeroides]MCE6971700.1 PepSY domain-containing protein [Cereibacter sphaeroides]
MKNVLLTAAALSIGATMAAAEAALPVSAALSALEVKGYTVHEIEAEGARFEVEAVSPAGTRVELLVDAATADILRERRDD